MDVFLNWLSQYRRFLLLVLGFLTVVFLIEAGVMFLSPRFEQALVQKQTAVPTPSIILRQKLTSLPLSNPNNRDAKWIEVSSDSAMVYWIEHDFRYQKKNSTSGNVLPFAFLGKVKRVRDRNILLEGAYEKTEVTVTTLPQTRFQQAVRGKDTKISSWQTITLQDIAVGKTIQVNFKPESWNKGVVTSAKIFVL